MNLKYICSLLNYTYVISIQFQISLVNINIIWSTMKQQLDKNTFVLFIYLKNNTTNNK